MGEIILDWKAIRPLDGSRAKGFEELCSQLGRQEVPSGSRFERKGTPDAGVECYTVLENGDEWGWQAKYFDKLGDSQWSQIQNSVSKALEKHPRLVRYYICLPIDLPDARIRSRMSAKDRWDSHVSTWTQWATDKGMQVEFIYWGRHELLDRLKDPENTGRVRFWFDVTLFNHEWFTLRLEESIKTAGPRYTPKIHVDLPISKQIDSFSRSEQFFDEIKRQAQYIRRRSRHLIYLESKMPDSFPHEEILQLLSAIETILSKFNLVSVQPTGDLPFRNIEEQIKDVLSKVETLINTISKQEQKYEADSQEDEKEKDNQYAKILKDYRFRLLSLSALLGEVAETLQKAYDLASSNLLILNGTAGTGKTHLLCDIAQNRVAQGNPTVLLMGQRFISPNEPWTQVLQQLDLAGLSIEEFVGAIEASAQAANCRALIMIDAINEGAGRIIWRDNLPAFLSHIYRSPWLGIVISIRTPYEEVLIPKEIMDAATTITHEGFTGYEYEATLTYFSYYGLNLPSTPLLSPEFQNPFFLKTICESLNSQGEDTLPHGSLGITTIFNMYLDAVNKKLASSIGFNSRKHLVRQSLEQIIAAIIDSAERWISLEQAEKIVNDLLPGKEYEKSLYRGLVIEEILIEELVVNKDGNYENVVIIGYDRFADHLITNELLKKHIDPDKPEAAFLEGAPLAFLWDNSQYVTPGLLEAMCIQVSERFGKELVILAPEIINKWGIADAFRQSLIWRDYSAFSDKTKETLNKLINSKHDFDDTLEVILTVATLPDHPFNARFLDNRLRKDNMAERDAWWSIFLHQFWDTHTSIDRLVNWAFSVTPETDIDDETVYLSSITLAWMLSTSNRFLRDNATKSLVNLLTGRPDDEKELVKWVADIDDMYIVERVFAVAYGVTMRSYKVQEIGSLAQSVYDFVFKDGKPYPHILFRDYARGIIERAIYLDAKLDIQEDVIHPPYSSDWPDIPDEKGIKPYLPDWSRGSHDSRDIEWSRNRIGMSITNDDFARYIISDNWTSLPLSEPVWQSPEKQILELTKEFSPEEMKAWEFYRAADEEVSQYSILKTILISKEGSEIEERSAKSGSDFEVDLEKARKKRDELFNLLKSTLTEEHAEKLEKLLSEKGKPESRFPTRFDAALIQRYILKRVFDLGWTTESFGEFDRFEIGYDGRSSHKAERIGKKYQWIAYHEIMAMIADHYQYGGQFGHEIELYEGPWQELLRDIDPSCILRNTYSSFWDKNVTAWWCSVNYETWDAQMDGKDWLEKVDDLPSVDKLLAITNPTDNTKWINLQSFFILKQPIPADQYRYDVENRELWYLINGYFINSQDKEKFIDWATNVDFWGRWMPDPKEEHRIFLGEYGWSPAYNCFLRQYKADYQDPYWIQPGNDCPTRVLLAAYEYLRESSGYDCSVNDTLTIRLPVSVIVHSLNLKWSGQGGNFLNQKGETVIVDPAIHEDGPSSLLITEDILKQFLEKEGLSLCWTILGEKMALGPAIGNSIGSLRITGAYLYDGDELNGFTKNFLEIREER